MTKALFRKVDCIRIPVSDLELALVFYRDSLGHELLWRKENSVGLRIPESEAELVIHTEPELFEVDLKVESAERAAKCFKDAGGEILYGPFDIPIGKCVVVKDPWNNKLVLLDSSKGTYVTDSKGKVIGLKK
ncbi:MAG: bleomycin resistance protein [Candidatus Lokiarchaeota archaeon]|jgi:lactoylglutathione lyase